jgi:succinate dehydrogenase / fumarate reductase membrane anchor subunit
MSLRTPLGRVRGLGSAKSGAQAWWRQKLGAVALIPLTVWFVASLAGLAGADHATVVAWLKDPLAAILLLLFIGVGFFHLRAGAQEIIEDYIHVEGLKVASLMAVTFACYFFATMSAFAVLKISFGG